MYVETSRTIVFVFYQYRRNVDDNFYYPDFRLNLAI